jgi:hypothetical protein
MVHFDNFLDHSSFLLNRVAMITRYLNLKEQLVIRVRCLYNNILVLMYLQCHLTEIEIFLLLTVNIKGIWK